MKLLGVGLLIIGAISILSAVIVPYTIENSIRRRSLELVALSDENEPFWNKALSGSDPANGVEITRQHFLYNCTNVPDVLFRGAKPEYQEIGPFNYSEVNQLTDLVYKPSSSEPQRTE